MCGIVGVSSKVHALNKSIAGLMALSYRGYDSAGIATVSNNEFNRVRSVGKIENLCEKLKEYNFDESTSFIGHTRWATHGKPEERNAHPIVSGNVAVVHNGVIENFLELKEKLKNDGVKFESDTDTEVAAALVNKYFSEDNNPINAVQNALKEMTGSYAFAFMFSEYNNLIITAKKHSPLIIGISNENIAFCSDQIGLLGLCDEVYFFNDGEISVIDGTSVKFYNNSLSEISPKFEKLSIKPEDVGKGVFDTFMMKEINEQPAVIAKTLEENSDIDINVNNVVLNIIACGSSFNAGLVGKYWFEKYKKIKVNVEVASEYAYRNPFITKNEAFTVISQSGETSDVLSAMKLMKRYNCDISSIVNVKNSSIDRLSDHSFYTEAGIEVGVASTKAFLAQLTVLAKLAFGRDEKLKEQLSTLSQTILKLLECECEVEKLAEWLKGFKSVIFVGRDVLYPIAIEGALKLKELSYIHAEAIPFGELKHGPIALIDDSVAIVALISSGELFQKARSNLLEILARGKNVAVITDKTASQRLPSEVRKIVVDDIGEAFAPFTFTIPLQFLAYYVANKLGRDIDKPRNLAKSVTVE